MIKGFIFSLPKEHLCTLLAFLQLCQLIMEESITKMTSQALATCITPNIMFDISQTELKIIQEESIQCNKIMEFLIDDFPFLLQVKSFSARIFLFFFKPRNLLEIYRIFRQEDLRNWHPVLFLVGETRILKEEDLWKMTGSIKIHFVDLAEAGAREEKMEAI